MISPTDTCDSALLNQAKTVAFILESELGSPVAIYNGANGDTILPAHDSVSPLLESTGVEQIIEAARRKAVVSVASERSYLAVLALSEQDGVRMVAAGRLQRFARGPDETAREIQRLEKWCLLLADKLTASPRRAQARVEGNERETRAWDLIAALDAVLRSGRLHGDRGRYQRRVLKAVAEVLGADVVIWAPRENHEEVVLRGEVSLSPWQARQFASSILHRNDWDATHVLIDNQLGPHAFSDKFPDAQNLLALKVSEEEVAGCLLAINKRESPGKSRADAASAVPAALSPFRRSDAALLASFTSLLGLQARTSLRFQEMKNFVVGLIRSLAAAIDAKDKYTYGHSERVARISVELAKELQMKDEEVSDVYLSGLLHDVGKIGIRDAVLGKDGPLTDEERKHMEQHVTIGYHILSALNPIKHLLGGVLYHHERVDGRGYPEGLTGERIPSLAKIIAVADSFDAMSSDRPYREHMPAEKVESILRSGAGVQWDSQVIDAFFRCQEQVRAIRQRGVGESLRNALDGALRQAAPYEESLKLNLGN